MRISEWLSAYRSMRQTKTFDSNTHLKRAGQWLLKAQQAGQGGYAHSYSLIKGWQPAYPETTGYILETLFRLSDSTGDTAYRESALKAAQWLLTIQNADGSFRGMTGDPFVFDTAQVLAGLLYIFKATRVPAYLEAAIKSADWLLRQQETDGSFVRHAYGNRAHTYYIKVSSPLLVLASLTDKNVYRQAALKNIAWTLAQQQPNGFFKHASFDQNETPFLHTIIYILEGLLECHRSAPSDELRTAIDRLARALLTVERRDFLFYSRYDGDGRAILKQRCLVGMAQWAQVAVELHTLFGDDAYRSSAIKNNYYLKSKQLRTPEGPLQGALPASIPFWGEYVPYAFVNWGIKYFIDALLAAESYHLEVFDEQEIYVREAFQSGERYVPATTLSREERDGAVFQLLKEEVVACQKHFPGTRLVIADVGAGQGAWANALHDAFPSDEVVGIDPTYFDAPRVRQGTLYRLPLAEHSVHVIFLKEVLQHVEFMDRVFTEIKRVLRPGGTLVIVDRNPMSLAGALKKRHEAAGKWMYPWDSAFMERWYSAGAWKKRLARYGALRRVVNIENTSGRPYENRHLFFSLTMA